jgi:pimeloyl-ACP methyl ester carboxylesterase
MLNGKKCEAVQIVTPGKVVLDGLWYGDERIETAYIFVHGLASTVFAHHEYLLPLLDAQTGLLFFSNRGHDKVTGVRKIDRRKKKGYSRFLAGQAHEVFTECADDLDGAVNLAAARGAKKVILVGHSTGSQKTVYYLGERGKQKKVSGAVLVAPMSDYAGEMKADKTGDLPKAQQLARKMVKEGREHEVLPLTVWPDITDAQRFLSLYTPESQEEIFGYAQPGKKPERLKKVKIPTLVILAEKDEYRDRPMKQIAKWFGKYLRKRGQKVITVTGAGHSFDGWENRISEEIKLWKTEAVG